MKHRDIIEKMTLEEKCAYLSGKNAWDTRSFSSIGVDVLHHADGPTGVRKQASRIECFRTCNMFSDCGHFGKQLGCKAS